MAAVCLRQRAGGMLVLLVVAVTLGTLPLGGNSFRKNSRVKPEAPRMRAKALSALTVNATSPMFVQKAGSASLSGDTSILPSNPVDLVAVLYIVFSSLYCFKVMFSDLAIKEKLEEVRLAREALTDAYNATVTDMVSRLQEISESNGMFVETTFHSHARFFQQFLNDLGSANRRFLTSEISHDLGYEQFRLFLRLWLRVFEGCSLNPRRSPRRIITDTDMRKFQTIPDLALEVARRMARSPINFISDTQQLRENMKSQDKGAKKVRTPTKRNGIGCCGCCGWVSCGVMDWGIRYPDNTDLTVFPFVVNLGCLAISILSFAHVLVLTLLAMGLALASLLYVENIVMSSLEEVRLSKIVIFVGVLVCIVLDLMTLSFVDQIDERSRLEKQVMELKEESHKIESQRHEINQRYEQMEGLMQLWQYRTIPHLQLFKELCQQVIDTPEEEKVEFVDGLSKSLERLDYGLGDLWMWEGNRTLDETLLKLGAMQLKDVARNIAMHTVGTLKTREILDRVANVPGFLSIRVLACHKLTNKSGNRFGEISDPYVIGKIGREGTRSFQTPPIRDNLNPRWDTAEQKESESPWFPLKKEENTFTLEVWDNKSHNPMGYVDVNFKELSAGLWHRRNEKLFSFRTHQVRGHGEIEYEFYFASVVRLLDKSWSRSRHARASRVLRMSQFLGSQPLTGLQARQDTEEDEEDDCD